LQPTKPGDQTEFAIPKPGPVEPKTVTQGPGGPAEIKPVKPVVAPKKAIKDLPLTTPHGVTMFRYEEYAPGKWRYLGEFPADGNATEESKPKPRTID